MARYLASVQRRRNTSLPPASPAVEAEARRRRIEVLKRFVPGVARTYLPRYSPHRIELSPEMDVLAAHYSAKAASIR